MRGQVDLSEGAFAYQAAQLVVPDVLEVFVTEFAVTILLVYTCAREGQA